MNSQKYNYKIFNTRTQKYMSWNQKATWTKRSWVAARLYGKKTEELEVHAFPIEAPIKQTAQSFLEEEAIAELERRSKLLALQEKRRKEQEHHQHLEDLRKLEELRERVELYRRANC